MTWKQRLLIAQMGVLFGVLSLFGLISGYEYYFAFGMIVFSAFLVSRIAQERFFTQGLIQGFLVWLVVILIQGLFIDFYFSNNPEAQEVAKDLPLGARAFTLLAGTAGAFVFGLVVGGFAFLINLVRGKNSR